MPDRPRERTLRLVRQGDQELEFERAFWARLTAEQRVECLWDMVLEARALKGLDGDEPRRQKSTARLLRRGA